MLRHLLAVLVLPFNVLVTVPAVLLWREGFAGPDPLAFSTDLGVLLAAVGLSLLFTTIALFVRVGRGTLAPWSPTHRLVVRGPYRRVRNPMISGVLFVLLGEALVFRSPSVLGWWALFFLANAVYLPLSEEPGLEARFGDDYRRYKCQVPRWIPRLTPVPASPPEA
ncbi:MAG TPA: isoprenylcysteine carboxylmethyltransferase family protein [Myxococcota bacterium]|nr:isoprenylcysteine carboxylmethyltransferase family protein [Myxococcota bacterium]